MNQKKINIAIDGFSSCGKSTLAKQLAKNLGYIYVDTGAMYRSVALYCINEGIIKDNFLNKQDLVAALPNVHIMFKHNPEHIISETFLNQENVEKEIRSMEVSQVVSLVSSVKEVRQKLVALQREMGVDKGVVMDGRDIGTVVFPNAELKLFMTAEPEVRVARRHDELVAKGTKVTLDEVRKNIVERDYIDTHRAEDPLRKADDAITIDNSDLTEQDQLELALKLVMERV